VQQFAEWLGEEAKTLPKGISNTYGAHLLASSILGIKNACKTSKRTA